MKHDNIVEAAKNKQDEEDIKAEEEKARKAAARKNKKNKHYINSKTNKKTIKIIF